MSVITTGLLMALLVKLFFAVVGIIIILIGKDQDTFKYSLFYALTIIVSSYLSLGEYVVKMITFSDYLIAYLIVYVLTVIAFSLAKKIENNIVFYFIFILSLTLFQFIVTIILEKMNLWPLVRALI